MLNILSTTFLSGIFLVLGVLRKIRPLRRLGSFFRELVYKTPPPQALMTSPQLIEDRGHVAEEHKIQTEDNYILTVYRIGPKRNGDLSNGGESAKNGKTFYPVILQHGYLNSSDDWLLNKDSLAFILAGRGHDVWVTNLRGNHHSRQHVTLSRRDSKYWDFCIDDFGCSDVPAVIRYILKLTGSPKVNYVGHSLGTTVFCVALNEHPELNNKVERMVALSPAFYVENSKSPLIRWPVWIPPKFLHRFIKLTTGGCVFAPKFQNFMKKHMPHLASARLTRGMCNNLVSFLNGSNEDQLTPDTTSLLLSHTPSDTSGKLVAHICQVVLSAKPHKFDYGPEGNLKKYGVTQTPVYDLSKVHVPVQAIYAVNDLIIDSKDAKRTIQELPNVRETIQVADPNWTHLDFIYGKDAKRFVYEPAVRFLEQESS